MEVTPRYARFHWERNLSRLRMSSIPSDVSGRTGLPDHGDWVVMVALVNVSLTVLGFCNVYVEQVLLQAELLA